MKKMPKVEEAVTLINSAAVLISTLLCFADLFKGLFLTGYNQYDMMFKAMVFSVFLLAANAVFILITIFYDNALTGLFPLINTVTFFTFLYLSLIPSVIRLILFFLWLSVLIVSPVIKKIIIKKSKIHQQKEDING